MSNKSDLPPPVTIRSSKTDLWEELQCALGEIDSINHELQIVRQNATAKDYELHVLQYQMSVVRSVMSFSIKSAVE